MEVAIFDVTPSSVVLEPTGVEKGLAVREELEATPPVAEYVAGSVDVMVTPPVVSVMTTVLVDADVGELTLALPVLPASENVIDELGVGVEMELKVKGVTEKVVRLSELLATPVLDGVELVTAAVLLLRLNGVTGMVMRVVEVYDTPELGSVVVEALTTPELDVLNVNGVIENAVRLSELLETPPAMEDAGAVELAVLLKVKGVIENVVNVSDELADPVARVAVDVTVELRVAVSVYVVPLYTSVHVVKEPPAPAVGV